MCEYKRILERYSQHYYLYVNKKNQWAFPNLSCTDNLVIFLETVQELKEPFNSLTQHFTEPSRYFEFIICGPIFMGFLKWLAKSKMKCQSIYLTSKSIYLTSNILETTIQVLHA